MYSIREHAFHKVISVLPARKVTCKFCHIECPRCAFMAGPPRFQGKHPVGFKETSQLAEPWPISRRELPCQHPSRQIFGGIHLIFRDSIPHKQNPTLSQSTQILNIIMKTTVSTDAPSLTNLSSTCQGTAFLSRDVVRTSTSARRFDFISDYVLDSSFQHVSTPAPYFSGTCRTLFTDLSRKALDARPRYSFGFDTHTNAHAEDT